MVEDAHAHGVDQGIALVTGVEADFPAHGGNPDAVAVVGDPGHHLAEQVADPGAVQSSEPEGVEQGNRTRAHGENVANDPADARRRPLEGLHGRRVVVAFDLEHHRLPVADVDHAGPFPGPLQNPGAVDGKAPEKRLGVFVTAVFRPHHAVDARLRPVGQPAETADHPLVFLIGQSQLPVQLPVADPLRGPAPGNGSFA